MYGLYGLVRQLRTSLNDTSDRIWSWDKKVRAIEAGVAALAENGILERRTDMSIGTIEGQFYYALPEDIRPHQVFAVYLPSESSDVPMAPIQHWSVEPRGETNMLALYRAYPESRALRVEYMAPFQVYPTVTTLSGAITGATSSIGVGMAANWKGSGFAEIWPKGDTSVGEVVYYGARNNTGVQSVQRGVEGPAASFAAGDTISPALNMAAEVKEMVLLFAQAECWAMRQAQSSRSQYLNNYANLEIKLRRQFTDRARRVQTRPPVRIGGPSWPRYGNAAGRAPLTVRDYFER